MSTSTMHLTSRIPNIFGRCMLAVLLVLVSACGESAGESDGAEEAGGASPGTLHPIMENVPGYDEIDHRIGMSNEAGGAEGAVAALASRFRRAEEVLSIGALEGDEAEMFGKIQDIAPAGGGAVYVLDEEYKEVRKYDAQGEHVWSFGREGEGPNEFMYPDALSPLGDGRLAVAGRMAKVKVFTPTDSSFTHEHTIQLDYTPEDLCTASSRIFAHGPDVTMQAPEQREEAGNVHMFSVAGEHLKTFGRLYRSGNPIIRSDMSRGDIACSSGAGTVAVALRYVPILTGYTLDGELKWRSELTDYIPTEVEETQRGARYSARRTNDMVMTLASAPGGYLIVQVYRNSPQGEEKREDEGFHTYLVSAERGAGTYVGDALPKIFAATQDRLYGAVIEPYPQMKVYALPDM